MLKQIKLTVTEEENKKIDTYIFMNKIKLAKLVKILLLEKAGG